MNSRPYNLTALTPAESGFPSPDSQPTLTAPSWKADLQVTVFSDLFSLRKSILAGDRITLKAEHFSRAVLKWLLDEGAFPADEWNKYDGKSDYKFLLKMFNKQNKDQISQKQEGKIYQMLRYKVIPFVRDHGALGSRFS